MTLNIVQPEEKANPFAFLQLTEAECGWLAGFWDGEGYVGIVPRIEMRYNHTHYTAMIIAANTHLETIQYIEGLFRRIGIFKTSIYTHPRHGKPLYTIQTQNIGYILAIGELIAPYSVTKAEQWSLTSKFCRNRLLAPRANRGETSFTAFEIALCSEVKKLNKRGLSI